MLQRLHVDKDVVEHECSKYYVNFGTTLAGLAASGHIIDYDEWHAFVHHTLPYEKLIRPDPQLRAVLQGMRAPKHIFTNADRKHAEICLRLLGVEDLIAQVHCFESIMEAAAERGYTRGGRVVCKPNLHAYELALEAAGSPDPRRVVWFDDSTRNVAAGHNLGFFSVLVGRTGAECCADAQVESIYDVPRELPWLMEASDARPDVRLPVSLPSRGTLSSADSASGVATSASRAASADLDLEAASREAEVPERSHDSRVEVEA